MFADPSFRSLPPSTHVRSSRSCGGGAGRCNRLVTFLRIRDGRSFFNSDVLLTATEVQKRLKDLREWNAQITALQKQVAETHAWLNLVAKLIGPERAHQLIGDVLLPAQVSTSNEAILPSEPHPRRSRMGDEVKRFLKTQTNGATSGQIIDHLLQTQEFQEGVQRNRNRVYNVLSRLEKNHELRKIEGSYYLLVAPPIEDSGSEKEAAVPSESREARLSSQASRDAEPRHSEVGKDQHASDGHPLMSTVHVELDLAADSSEVPRTNSLDPSAPAEAPPKTQRTNFGGPGPGADPSEVPPTNSSPTKSLFQTDPAEAPREVPPPTTRLLFQADPAEAPPEVQPRALARED